jgi:hypothetical protein
MNFLVGDGVLTGNPMAAVNRRRADKRAPKPLQGEDTPETLLRFVVPPSRQCAQPVARAGFRDSRDTLAHGVAVCRTALAAVMGR